MAGIEKFFLFKKKQGRDKDGDQATHLGGLNDSMAALNQTNKSVEILMGLTYIRFT